MSKEITEWESHINIDPDGLDVEWVRQASLMNKYSKKLANAERTTRRAEENLKIVRSEIILKVNKKGALPDGSKATGQSIEAYYRTHKDHIEAKEEVAEAYHKQQIFQAAVSALHQKKAALENLTRLSAQNYFAGPTEPRDLTRKLEEKKREEETIRKTMKKSRRKNKGGRSK